tara:strand:- start:876 stop:1493 length:618 start_codon:yes stop_codon:yes gene_type:complete
MKTSSEIITVCKRAAKASGYSWGISEEIGKNINLLEVFGISGIENFNHFLKDDKREAWVINKKIDELNSKDEQPLCPIYLGINFLDHANKIEKLEKITINNLAYPLLFLPFIQRVSKIISKGIQILIDDKIELELFLNNTLASNTNIRETIIENASKIIITVLENQDSFSSETWSELYDLSTKTFVEESERLKSSAAGAGLVDND